MEADPAFTKALLDLTTYYRLKQYTPESKQPMMLRQARESMNAMILRVGRLEPNVLDLFRAHNYRSIESMLEYTNDRKFPELRTFHDRLKTAIQYEKPKATLDRVTILFENFIKGITYFCDQEKAVRQPIYHRLLSCGSGSHAFRDTFLKCDVPGAPLSRQDRRERSERIQRCYIERQIYDAIWQHEHLHLPRVGTEERTPQDDGHEYFMNEVHSDFQTCFPDMTINAEVQYDSNNMPVRLMLVRSARGVVTSKEVYQKEVIAQHLYGSLVDAARWTPRQSYMKVQSFEVEKPWRPVEGDALEHIRLIPRPLSTQKESRLAQFNPSVRMEMNERFGGKSFVLKEFAVS